MNQSQVFILSVRGTPAAVLPTLQQRFPTARNGGGYAILIPFSRPETPDAVMAYCATQGIKVVGTGTMTRKVVRP